MAIGEKSLAWFSDGQNRDEAVRIMVDASKLKPEDVAKAYDFLRDHKFFANAGKISRKKLDVLISALRELGDIEGSADVERFIATGIVQVMD
jgi:geranylgeranyl pyrophosphate synthase